MLLVLWSEVQHSPKPSSGLRSTMVTLKINSAAGSNKRYLSSPPLFRGLGVEIERALNM